LATAPLVGQGAQAPVARRTGVGHGFQGGEGLGGDDEQRLRRIQVARRLDEVGRVDIGDEAEGHAAFAVVFQGFVGHHRAEVGAADADVDDVADALAGVAGPGAAAQAVGEVRHLVEHRMHCGDHVLAVEDDALVTRRAQGDVQHCPLLGDVDLLPAEHGVDPPAQPALLGQLHQQTNGFVGDEVLGVVQIETGAFRCQALTAPPIGGEKAPATAQHASVRDAPPGPARPDAASTLPVLSSPFPSPYVVATPTDPDAGGCQCKPPARSLGNHSVHR